MEIQKADNFIWSYNNVYRNPEYIISQSLKEFWSPYTNSAASGGGGTINGAASMIFKENKLYKEILSVFLNIFNHYINENNINLNIKNLDINPIEDMHSLERKNILIRRYDSGSWMDPHEDAGTDTQTSFGLAPAYTGLFYLNDDYEGGELNFPDFNHTIKPKKSSITIFPSKYRHEVLLLKKGNRYMTSAYLYNW